MGFQLIHRVSVGLISYLATADKLCQQQLSFLMQEMMCLFSSYLPLSQIMDPLFQQLKS